MADIFKTKEVESLRVENTSLKSKIETFEVRVSNKDKQRTWCRAEKSSYIWANSTNFDAPQRW